MLLYGFVPSTHSLAHNSSAARYLERVSYLLYASTGLRALPSPLKHPDESADMSGFGTFGSICRNTPLPLCLLVGAVNPITGTHYTQANCYARTIEVANTIIFEGAAGFAHILALIMTVIMIIHVRSKFTAVGMSMKGYG